MGEPAQRRLIRKLDLERFIGQLKPNAAPKVGLEQYNHARTKLLQQCSTWLTLAVIL
jgi:hypothetical protein